MQQSVYAESIIVKLSNITTQQLFLTRKKEEENNIKIVRRNCYLCKQTPKTHLCTRKANI